MNFDSITEIIGNILRPMARFLKIKNSYKFIKWCVSGLHHINSRKQVPNSRVLAIYDTTSQPFSVGDLLICLEASLILCTQHNVSYVDLAFVYSEDNPDCADPIFRGRVTKDNVFFHLASLLPLAQVNQNLASIFIFNSQAQLQRYINDNLDLYHIWPSAWLMSKSKYLSPVIFNSLLYQHFEEYKSIPYLTCRPFLREWAVNFYNDNLVDKVPVTVNLRNNSGWAQQRNSCMESWLEFFRHCETRYKVMFIIICAFSEIDERFRQCSNVLIAKDHHTGVEQDMALIHTSAIHMGAGSGPATMAWFNNKPYLMVNTDFRVGDFYEYPDMIEQVSETIQRLWFSSPFQHIASGMETPELLINEFELMWQSVGLKYLQNTSINRGKASPRFISWLR